MARLFRAGDEIDEQSYARSGDRDLRCTTSSSLNHDLIAVPL